MTMQTQTQTIQNNELLLQVHNSLATQKLPTTQAKQVLAQALLETLHNWCMQLFWMTVLCVINCCGEEEEKKPSSSSNPSRKPDGSKKRIEDIEQKMLRHLTSPMIAGPLRPVVRRVSKRRVTSRPPSPQLFDIAEEQE